MLRVFLFLIPKFTSQIKVIHFITDPNYFYLFIFLLFTLIFVCRRYEDQLASPYSGNKSCLREYNVVGVKWYTYSCKCTEIYIGKLNTLNEQ
jgi:hypothetical protein